MLFNFLNKKLLKEVLVQEGLGCLSYDCEDKGSWGFIL